MVLIENNVGIGRRKIKKKKEEKKRRKERKMLIKELILNWPLSLVLVSTH
jgi:hypothetical protein